MRHRITLGVFGVHPLVSGAEHASLYSLDIHVYTFFVDLPFQVITLSFKPFVIELMFWMEISYQNTSSTSSHSVGCHLLCNVLNFNKVSLFSLTNSALCIIFV